MAKKNSLKKALITSALSMVLCSSMLVGTTYAWFTDSVTSTGNVIQTGTLDVSLEHADTVLAADDAGWTDASTGAIFNYSNWEPGYTIVKYVKVENEGSLDLKFVLNIVPNKAAEEVNLADVIEVYMLDKAVEVQRNTLTTDNVAYVGTLTSLMNETDGAAHGVLYADDADKAGNVYEIYTIVLKMSESAGNEYMDKSVGGGFSVQLLATQLASEKDSIDENYDAGAGYATSVSTAEELQAALRKGGKIVLTDDISLDAGAEFMATNGNGSLLDLNNVNVTLDLNGHDIVAEADALMDGKTTATALFLVHKNSTFNIVGEGNIITKNQAIPVYGWNNSEINIYGGKFIGNAYERNESDVYVNYDTVTINVYGGDFTESGYAFNAHDTYAKAPVIVLHEGVTFKKFLKNGTTDVIASDINAGRIVLADGMGLDTYEKDGKTWCEVVAKAVYIEDVKYASIAEAIAAADDGDAICLTAGTFYEALNLQGKSLTIQGAGKGDTVIAGPKDYTTANIPMQSWAGWSGQDANVYALISANKDVAIKDLTVSADPVQIGEVAEFRHQGDCAFVGIHVQSANATIENVDINNIKPNEVTGNDHHNFGLYITSAVNDTATYTATYKNGTVSNVNRGGIYCWSGNYTLAFEGVTVKGPGSPTKPNGSLKPAENNDAIYAFAPFYVCSSATYKEVVIKDSWCVAGWGGASWAWANSAWATNPPEGVTCENCGMA